MATQDLESSVDGHLLKFNGATHRYWLNGKPIKGVSSIKDVYPKGDGLTNWKIKNGIEQALPMYQTWFATNGVAVLPEAPKLKALIDELMIEVKKEKKTKRAADIGQLLHEYAYCIENHLPFDQSKVETHPDRKHVEIAMANFTAWHGTCKDIVVKSEQIVASVRHWFAGTFDRLVLRGDQLVLSDFKTSGKIGVEHKLQLAAYRIAIREWLKLEVTALEILRFDKETIGFDPARDIWITNDPAEMAEHEEQFLRLLATVRYDQKFNPWAKRG